MSKVRYISTCAALVCTLAGGIIAGFEGKSNKAYLDAVQVPTICHGITHNVKLGDYKTDAECAALLRAEVERTDAILSKHAKVYLQPHERVAFISWIYNVGEGNFVKSTLLKKLNKGDVAGACNELPKWTYAKGKKLKGLVTRRENERKICLGEKPL